jgi:hypothetical protein
MGKSVLPKRWDTSTNLHGVISHKTHNIYIHSRDSRK